MGFRAPEAGSGSHALGALVGSPLEGAKEAGFVTRIIRLIIS